MSKEHIKTEVITAKFWKPRFEVINLVMVKVNPVDFKEGDKVMVVVEHDENQKGEG